MCKMLPKVEKGFITPKIRQYNHSLISGLPTKVGKNDSLNNILDHPLHVTCLHPTGRSDSYTLAPGEALLIDEDAEITITNAKEIEAKAREQFPEILP